MFHARVVTICAVGSTWQDSQGNLHRLPWPPGAAWQRRCTWSTRNEGRPRAARSAGRPVTPRSLPSPSRVYVASHVTMAPDVCHMWYTHLANVSPFVLLMQSMCINALLVSLTFQTLFSVPVVMLWLLCL